MDAYAPGIRTDDETAVRLAESTIDGVMPRLKRRSWGMVCRIYRAARLGVRSKTIRQGQAELEGGRPGHRTCPEKGVDARLIAICPDLEENVLKVLHDHTAGDPMRADVKWTNLSRRQIAERVTAMGTPASRNVASLLLRKHGYRRRKALEEEDDGTSQLNRNAQFENIARLKKEYLKAGLPVLSMDTKKKELLGNFHRDGTIDTQATIRTNDHDFGKRAKYGDPA